MLVHKHTCWTFIVHAVTVAVDTDATTAATKLRRNTKRKRATQPHHWNSIGKTTNECVSVCVCVEIFYLLSTFRIGCVLLNRAWTPLCNQFKPNQMQCIHVYTYYLLLYRKYWANWTKRIHHDMFWHGFWEILCQSLCHALVCGVNRSSWFDDCAQYKLQRRKIWEKNFADSL